MKILDKNGNYVTTLSPGKQKGLNLVYWNFNGSAPKTATGKTFSQAGAVAPRVEAGTYTIVIEKGKETFQTTIEVAYPKNSVYTLAERKQQEAATQELFQLNEELAYLVYELEEWTKHANEQTKLQPKISKVATKLATTMETLRAELVITTGDNYVGRAENKLREDLGEIYVTIAGNVGPPTASQLDGIALIKEKMQEARKKMEAIRVGDLKKYQDQLKKLELVAPSLQTFTEYVLKD